jgi:hypothetical protein
LTKRLIQFARLPSADRVLLVEATVALSVAGLRLSVTSFARIASGLGRHMDESADAVDAAALKQAARVRWAVETVARHLPWKPVCLPQALAAKRMLQRRGIASTLYLGVDPAKQLDAHAWVRVGRMIVTGGPREDRFAVVSTFT